MGMIAMVPMLKSGYNKELSAGALWPAAAWAF